LAAGGEGTVHILAGDETLLAKLYNQPPTPSTVEKLRWMVETASPSLRQLAAWPSAVLFDNPNGRVVGFLMPRFHDYQPIHHLYNPAQRLKYFPRADWSFLAAAARNCAAAFEEIHQVGCLVGDVNQSNVLVSRKALIGLIDCDSFQVQADGRQFLCEVGVPHYTPPELQRRNFTGLVRTLNHDRFGLAVLMFQLLFMGRHPYAGRYLGKGDLPFEQLIQEFRFAYGPDAAALQMERPPYTLTLLDMSPDLARLFERAFERGSDAPDARPTATQWLAALDEFRPSLRPCPKDPGHKIPAHRSVCPWCEFIGQGGPNYFRGVAVVAVVFRFDGERLRTLKERVHCAATTVSFNRSRFLPREPIVPRALPADFDEARTLSRVLGGVAVGGLALVMLSFVFTVYLALFGVPVLVVFGLWWLIHRVTSPRYREYRRRLHTLTNAETLLRRAERDCQRLHGDYLKRKELVHRSLDRVFEECSRLEERFRGEGLSLEINREAMLLEQHLRSCFLSDADIPGIGPTRQQMLASFGIETAFDIEPGPIDMIKGFGKVLTGNLMAWKKQMMKEFRYDPSKSVPEAELRTLALKYQQTQDMLFAQLERGAVELEKLAGALERELQAREPELRQRTAAWAQAEADLQVLASRRRRG
jgi:DNA-binding helix-hairpin-helix protein with protein kinase domain